MKMPLLAFLFLLLSIAAARKESQPFFSRLFLTNVVGSV